MLGLRTLYKNALGAFGFGAPGAVLSGSGGAGSGGAVHRSFSVVSIADTSSGYDGAAGGGPLYHLALGCAEAGPREGVSGAGSEAARDTRTCE